MDITRIFGAQIVRGPMSENVNVTELQSDLCRLLARKIARWRTEQYCSRKTHWTRYKHTSLCGMSYQLRDCSYWGDLRAGNWRTALYLLHRLHANNYDPVYEPGAAERDSARLKNLISSITEALA